MEKFISREGIAVSAFIPGLAGVTVHTGEIARAAASTITAGTTIVAILGSTRLIGAGAASQGSDAADHRNS